MPQEGRARPRGALEREVLACLAAAGEPLAPGEVLAGLGDSRLAYTTVTTTLSRLHGKGAVTREPAGRGYVYALRGGTGDDAQASMTARRMLKLLEGRPDRASVLSQFIADLSPADEQLLTGLLADGRPAGAAAGDGDPGDSDPGDSDPGDSDPGDSDPGDSDRPRLNNGRDDGRGDGRGDAGSSGSSR